MRVWLVTIGEPLPIDPGDERLLRAGIVAQTLRGAGHEVVWWTSNFNHSLKRRRYPQESSVAIDDGYTLHLLDGGGYRKNISFARMRDHHRLARRFVQRARLESPPDVILCSFPPIELSEACVDYARSHRVPIVLDIRDLWPDIFVYALPTGLRTIGRMAMARLTRAAERACVGATAIWGNGPALVEWGLQRAARSATDDDRVFPHAYTAEMPVETEAGYAYWREHGLEPGGGELIACFVGTMGYQFDVGTVLEAAREVGADAGIRFVFCGTGERLEAWRRSARDLHHVIFAGWRRRPEIWALLRLASLGLAPYVERADFLGTIPNKIPEYLSAGLPIALSFSQGYLHDLVVDQGFGFTYDQDATKLAAALRQFRTASAGLVAMRQRASAVFETRFRADVVYGSMTRELERLARTRGRAGATARG